MHGSGQRRKDRIIVQPHDVTVHLFGWALRLGWAFLFSATVAIEVIPRDLRWGPGYYYPYTASKAILFVLLGFFTPFAIWNFKSLGLGILFAALAAGIVESAQYLLAGHHASILEFSAKVTLLILGFANALVVRNDHRLRIGSLRVILSDPHSSENR